MRVLLIANPSATSTSPRTVERLVSKLTEQVDVEVVETTRRGHAISLATKGMHDRKDVVLACGGDGTVNEVINGLLADGTHHNVPAIGVIPTGSTNVFGRSLGLPNDPHDAAARVLTAISDWRVRRIGLGRADERWFAFVAGLGFDAAVVKRVEDARENGRNATNLRYINLAFRTYFTSNNREPQVHLELPDGTVVDGLYWALVSNADPWTYVGNRPLRPTPDASFDKGLDVYGRTRMGLPGLLWGAAQVLDLLPKRADSGSYVARDLPSLTLRSDVALPMEIDGDWVGTRDTVRFTSVPDALNVLV